MCNKNELNTNTQAEVNRFKRLFPISLAISALYLSYPSYNFYDDLKHSDITPGAFRVTNLDSCHAQVIEYLELQTNKKFSDLTPEVKDFIKAACAFLMEESDFLRQQSRFGLLPYQKDWYPHYENSNGRAIDILIEAMSTNQVLEEKWADFRSEFSKAKFKGRSSQDGGHRLVAFELSEYSFIDS